jgi:hypothetical protein
MRPSLTLRVTIRVNRVQDHVSHRNADQSHPPETKARRSCGTATECQPPPRKSGTGVPNIRLETKPAGCDPSEPTGCNRRALVCRNPRLYPSLSAGVRQPCCRFLELALCWMLEKILLSS